LTAFEVVVNNYADSRKVPDALLKIGYCNYELKRWDVARAALEKVRRDYPDTTAARLAEQRLGRMQSSQDCSRSSTRSWLPLSAVTLQRRTGR
jgi:TolA-binding protein